MKTKVKILIFLFFSIALLFKVEFCFSERQNNTQGDYKKEKENIENFAKDIGTSVSNDVLEALNKELDEAIEMAQDIVVFTIPDESGYIIIENSGEAAQNRPYDKRKRIDTKNMSSALKNFYNKDRVCNMVVLNVGSSVTYQYVYKVINDFEKFLRNHKLDKVKNVEIKYIFAKPL